jgi:hypothetical protein
MMPVLPKEATAYSSSTKLDSHPAVCDIDAVKSRAPYWYKTMRKGMDSVTG